MAPRRTCNLSPSWREMMRSADAIYTISSKDSMMEFLEKVKKGLMKIADD